MDTAWVPGAAELRELELGAFVPAGGRYVDIACASNLARLELARLPGSDAEQLRELLPLAQIELHDPIETRNPDGVYPFDLIWELDDEHPHFMASPELAGRWGVYNDYEAESHLEALLEDVAPDLFARVDFDASAESQSISADSRSDLERVLEIAFDARSAQLERHLWNAIETIQYDLSRRIGDYDMWEKRDVRAISVRLANSEQLTATVSVNDDEAVFVVGDADGDPEGAQLVQTWRMDIEDSEPLAALRRLAIRVVRALRRYDTDSPPIDVDGMEPLPSTA